MGGSEVRREMLAIYPGKARREYIRLIVSLLDP